MKNFMMLMAALLVIAFPSYAARNPSSAGKDPRVQTVLYNSVDVVRVTTNVKFNTAIEFGDGERVKSVLLGDSESYEVNVLKSGNVIAVKPVVARAATNMTVYTNRRTYSVYLAEGVSKAKTFRVIFKYPETNKRVAAKPDIGVNRSISYEWSGNKSIKPIRIWNNGSATFFEFRRDLRPSIFGVNGSGNEHFINSTTKGNIVRVRGTGKDFTIRLGDQYICIRKVDGVPTKNKVLSRKLAQKELGWK